MTPTSHTSHRFGAAALQPLHFAPNLRPVIWGGHGIASFKGVAPAREPIGESWEISGMPGHESVVDRGLDEGLNLRELAAKYSERLLGRRVCRQHDGEFPLLVKLIDAHDNLSVQVHPGEELARMRHGCPGKTEMWYIISSQPGAALYAGLKKPITRQQYHDLLASNGLLDAMQRHATHGGDLFFLPAGTLHSIGAGNLLCEVQQASDVTYRVYDFERVDSDGRPRQLHTAQAADAISFGSAAMCKCEHDISLPVATLVNCPAFMSQRVTVKGTTKMAMPFDSFLAIVCVAGKVDITCDNGSAISLSQGFSTLVPAEIRQLALSGEATIITATV